MKTGIFTGALLGIQGIFSKRIFAQKPKKGSVMIVAHIDDEILWLLPWLHQVEKVVIASLPATAAHLNIINKYASNYDALWQFGRGITSTQDYKERWLDPEIRRDLITEGNYDRMLRDIIADPGVTEIWTHNPWGEYSHKHHKDVSKIVRKLAAEYNKTVWCSMTLVTFPGYVYDTANLYDFEYQVHEVNLQMLYKIRQAYLDEPVNQTFPVNYWTWKNDNDYPNTQTFFKAVDCGIDLTIGHPEIDYLIESLPTYGI